MSDRRALAQEIAARTIRAVAAEPHWQRITAPRRVLKKNGSSRLNAIPGTPGTLDSRLPKVRRFLAADAKMSPLFFVCPETGREVSTGIDIDTDSFERGLPRVLAEINCPECGSMHNLFGVETRLSDEQGGNVANV